MPKTDRAIPNIGDLIRYEDIHNPKIGTYWLRLNIVTPLTNRERPLASVGILGRAARDPIDEFTYFTVYNNHRVIAFRYDAPLTQFRVLYKPELVRNVGIAAIEKYYRHMSKNLLTDEVMSNVNVKYDLSKTAGLVYRTSFRKQYHYYVSIDIKDDVFLGYKIAESDGYATVVKVPMMNNYLTGVKEQTFIGKLLKPKYITYLTFYYSNVMFYDDVDALTHNIMPIEKTA